MPTDILTKLQTDEHDVLIAKFAHIQDIVVVNVTHYAQLYRQRDFVCTDSTFVVSMSSPVPDWHCDTSWHLVGGEAVEQYFSVYHMCTKYVSLTLLPTVRGLAELTSKTCLRLHSMGNIK